MLLTIRGDNQAWDIRNLTKRASIFRKRRVLLIFNLTLATTEIQESSKLKFKMGIKC
jgi:hypothetical protein